MIDNTILTGSAMLEIMWKTRNKDVLDLITPFIVYSIGKCTSPNNRINTAKVLEYVQNNFGYSDMPMAIIEKILNRNEDNYFEKGIKSIIW